MTTGATGDQRSLSAAGLRELAEARGILIGAAVAAKPVAEDATYQEVLAREFNCLTCENVMKSMYL